MRFHPRTAAIALAAASAVLLIAIGSATAGAQAEDDVSPIIQWDAPNGRDDVDTPLTITGQVIDDSAFDFQVVVHQGIRRTTASPGQITFEPDGSFEVRDLTFEVGREREIRIVATATDEFGNRSRKVAEFLQRGPTAEFTSPLPGAVDVEYQLVVTGTADRGPLSSLRLTVTFQQGVWINSSEATLRADGTFTRRFDPRLMAGWVWSDEPWTVTVSKRSFPRQDLATVEFTSAEVVDYCGGYAVTVNMGEGDSPTDGQDIILGTEDSDVIDAGSGNDVICALGGRDRIDGGDGNDLIFGGDHRDRITAGAGNDRVSGGSGDDWIKLGHGDDYAQGDGGDDVIFAGLGTDRVLGQRGANRLYGGSGNDFLNGGNRNSIGSGDRGRDLCRMGTFTECEVDLIP